LEKTYYENLKWSIKISEAEDVESSLRYILSKYRKYPSKSGDSMRWQELGVAVSLYNGKDGQICSENPSNSHSFSFGQETLLDLLG